MGITGRRIWYGTAIFLSGLVLLISAISIVGVWLTERNLVKASEEILDSVQKISESVRGTAAEIDQKLESMQATTTFISTANVKLEQKVIDEGLILLLLPEEKEQNLVDLSRSVKDTINPFRNTLSASLAMYRSVNRLPFVNLPSPSQQQMDRIEESAGEINATADRLESEISAFRSGASNQISRVGNAADLLTTQLNKFRDRLAELDARLAIAQETIIQLQQNIVTAIVLFSVVITLLLAWIIWSQVEVLRLNIHRWQASGENPESDPISDQEHDLEAEVAEYDGSSDLEGALKE